MGSERVADTSDLLGRVARDEPGAVRDFVGHYGALVWSLALKRTRSREEAEDAVQEIFLDLWRSADRYDVDRSSEAGFVAMIARRRLIDRARKEARRPELTSFAEGMESGTDDHERIERRIEAGQVLEVVRSLPERQQELIELSLLDGLSHSQIAERTGTPLGTVKSNIRRGLIEVRKRLLGPTVDEQRAGAG